MKFGNNIDLNLNELQNVRIHNLQGTDPSVGNRVLSGLLYYNTTDRVLRLNRSQSGDASATWNTVLTDDVVLNRTTPFKLTEGSGKLITLTTLLNYQGSDNLLYIGSSLTFAAASTRTTPSTTADLEIVYVGGVRYLHTRLPFYSDEAVSSGGIGSSSGSGTGIGTVTALKLGTSTYQPTTGSTVIEIPVADVATLLTGAGYKLTDTVYTLTKTKIEAVLTGSITSHTHALSALTSDSTHRLVTDDQIASWNAKQAAIADVTDTASGYVSKVTQTSGKIAVTHANFTAPTLTWAGGTTDGPSLTVKTDGGTSSAVSIPSAAGNASGIVTTGQQTFGGQKTFSALSVFSDGLKVAASKAISFNGGTADSGVIPLIEYDATNHAIHFTCGIYSDKFVSSGGIASSSGSGSGGGLIQQVYKYSQLGGTYTDSTLTDTFNAYTIQRIHLEKAPIANPAFTGVPTAPTASANVNNTQLATTAFVHAVVNGLPKPMIFIGSLGTGGTATVLPAASSSNHGHMYKVITAGTYQGVAAKVGDQLISNGTSWQLIPSGDEPDGTVTNIAVTVPSGMTCSILNAGASANALTTYGTIALGFDASHALPTTTQISNWETAYLHAKDATALVTTLGNTAVNRAKADESGNNIKTSYAASLTCTDDTLYLKSKSDATLSSVKVPISTTKIESIDGTIGYRQIGVGTHASDYTEVNSAKVDVIKGNTIVWNQLIPNTGTSRTASGVTCTSNGNGEITLNGTSTVSGNLEFVTFGTGLAKSSHIVITMCIPISGTYQVTGNVAFTDGYGKYNLSIGGGTQYIQPRTSTSLNTPFYNLYNISVGDTFNNYKVRFMMFDLTKMFGAGNEPSTIEEFKAMFPNDYYPYNEGELVSFGQSDETAIKSVGFNLWDGNNARVFGNKTYYIGGTYTSVKFATTINGQQSSVTVSNHLFTPSNDGYIFVNGAGSDTIVNLSDASRNGTYQPYHENRLSLPIHEYKDVNGNVIFPNGLLSAGSVHDEITATGAIKRVGVVDLGTLTWTRLSQGYFRTNIPTNATLTNDTPNIICSKYERADGEAIYRRTAIGISMSPIYIGGHYICINDNIETISDFNTAINGVMLYYELATPIEYTFPERKPLSYIAEKGGYETLVPTQLAQAPFKGIVSYFKNSRQMLADMFGAFKDALTVYGNKIIGNEIFGHMKNVDGITFNVDTPTSLSAHIGMATIDGRTALVSQGVAVARRYSCTVTKSSATTYAINHGLGTESVSVSIYIPSGSHYELVMADVVTVSANALNIVFATVPTTNFHVVVIG